MAPHVITKAPAMVAPPNSLDNRRGTSSGALHIPTISHWCRPILSPTTRSMLTYSSGISGETIDFPDRAAAEIDLYSGVRPTLDRIYSLIQPPIVPSKRPSQYSRFGPAHPMPRDTTLASSSVSATPPLGPCVGALSRYLMGGDLYLRWLCEPSACMLGGGQVIAPFPV